MTEMEGILLYRITFWDLHDTNTRVYYILSSKGYTMAMKDHIRLLQNGKHFNNDLQTFWNRGCSWIGESVGRARSDIAAQLRGLSQVGTKLDMHDYIYMLSAMGMPDTEIQRRLRVARPTVVAVRMSYNFVSRLLRRGRLSKLSTSDEQKLIALRASGETYTAIGAILGISKELTRYHCKRLEREINDYKPGYIDL